MKNKYIKRLMVLGLTACLLGGCGNDKEETTKQITKTSEEQKEDTTNETEQIASGEETVNDSDIKAQLQVIAEESDTWMSELEYAEEVYQYAVTDLDADGRLEIIVSNMGGTGAYTYSQFYVVNEACDGLSEITANFMEGDSQPDIISDDEPVMAYTDSEGVIHYIVEDFIKLSAGEYYNAIGEISLKDDGISYNVLAINIETYDEEENCVETYEDANGNAISKEEYQDMAKTAFSDAVTQEEIVFGWRDVRALEGLSIEEVQKCLEESYSVWSEK